MDQLVSSHLLERLCCSVRPTHFDDLRFRAFGEAEVKPQVIHGIVARLTLDLLRLPVAIHTHAYASSDGSAIGPDTDQLYLQPVISGTNVRPQQGGRFVSIHDQHVHVAVIIEITEGTA